MDVINSFINGITNPKQDKNREGLGQELFNSIFKTNQETSNKPKIDISLDSGSSQSPLYSMQGLSGTLAGFFVSDLTQRLFQQGEAGEIDLQQPFCLGRERELEQLMLYLMIDKPTVLISGPTGVGKTYLVRELARKILTRDVAPDLQGCRIIEIDSDTPFTMSQQLYDTAGRNIIFFLDEFHSLAKDLVSWKKLSSAGARIIFASDRVPFFFKSDSAWKRRFIKLELTPLNFETSKAILSSDTLTNSLSRRLKKNVVIDESAILLALKVAPTITKKKPQLEGASFILECAVIWYYCHDEDPTEKLFSEADIKNYLITFSGVSEYQLSEMVAKFDQLSQSQLPAEEPLAKYTTNLMFCPSSASFEAAWERDDVLRSISYYLSAAESNNVILVGPAGCGKTRIAEGLVHGIKQGLYPALEGFEVLRLDPTQLSTEHELGAFIKSAERLSLQGAKFIIIIDEIHRMARHVDHLKEPLGRGSLRILGMTTPLESSLILKDDALRRRFVTTEVPPLTFEQTLRVLEKEALKKVTSHGQAFSQEVLTPILLLSTMYPRTLGQEIVSTAQPAAALRLFDIVYTYWRNRNNGEDGTLTIEDVIEAVSTLELLPEEEIRNHVHELQVSNAPSERMLPSSHGIFRFCTSWTALALKERQSAIVERREYLDELCNVLSHGNCNNVLLIGDSGVGKTTLVKDFARQLVIRPDEVPQSLRNKPLLAVEMSKITNPLEWAAFVETIASVRKDWILFIDEIHVLFRTHPVIGSSCIELLKPLLAEGLTLIGATTPHDLDFDRLDNTLRSRFSRINLPPPSRSELQAIVQPTLVRLKERVLLDEGLELVVSDELLDAMIDYPHVIQTPRNIIKILEDTVGRSLANPRDDDVNVLNLTHNDVVISADSLRLPPPWWHRYLPRRNTTPSLSITSLFLTSPLGIELLRTVISVVTQLIGIGFLGAVTLRYIASARKPR